MKKVATVLTLAMAVCFALISLAQAGALTTQQAGKYMPNTVNAVSMPIWQITQDGTNSAVSWVDATNPRFAVYDPGTPGDQTDDVVLDKETGLVWTRDANLDGGKVWLDAIIYARTFNNPPSIVGKRQGWRLPTVEELGSLVDTTQANPSLPSGHPFINVVPGVFCSSTEYEGDSHSAWSVYMLNGTVYIYTKSSQLFVWPVRGGN